MTNEIKEILELLKEDLYIPQEDNREYKLLDKGDDKLLLDYITNLQNEIFDLKDTIQNKNDCIGAYECIIEDRDKRIDKAINYILENICCDTRVYTKNENVYKVVDILRGDE